MNDDPQDTAAWTQEMKQRYHTYWIGESGERAWAIVDTATGRRADERRFSRLPDAWEATAVLNAAASGTPEETDAPAPEPGWTPQYAIVELLGHRRLVGRVREVALFGATFLEITDRRGQVAYYGAGALYGITPRSAEDVQAEWSAADALERQRQEWEAEHAARRMLPAITEEEEDTDAEPARPAPTLDDIPF